MGDRREILKFLALTFGISWAVVAFFAATMVWGTGETIGMVAMVFIGQFGPTLAALILTGRQKGRAGVGALLKSALAWRQPLGLWFVALLLYPLLFALAVALTVWQGATPPSLDGAAARHLAGTFAQTLVLGWLFGGFSEELGWRGYLLPRIQRRVGFLGAGSFIGGIWAVWHLDPEHVALLWQEGWGAFRQAELPVLGKYLAETIPLCFAMAWLYNRSGGALFLLILMHASSNAGVTALGLLWDEKPGAWGPTVLAVQWGAGLFFLILALSGNRRKAGQSGTGEKSMPS